MKAVAVPEFGALPRLMELPRPTPGAGEIRVRLRAAGMNPFDAKIASGALRGRPHVFPLILGVDGAGIVDSVGPGVRRFSPGDPVFGQFLHDPVGTGTYCEYALVPESIGIVGRPPSLSDAEAAALPTAGMTALDALDLLALGQGATLLVVGASGGIGSFVLPMARRRGLRALAVARSGAFARLGGLGAEEVWDVARPDWTTSFRAAHPDGIDGILDLMHPAEGFVSLLPLLREGGRGASTVFAARPETSGRRVTVANVDMRPSAELLDRLVREVTDARIAIPIFRTVSLIDAPAALEEIRTGHASGKIVILLDGPTAGTEGPASTAPTYRGP